MATRTLPASTKPHPHPQAMSSSSLAAAHNAHNNANNASAAVQRQHQLAALPSLSHALSALPQAQGMHHLALHEPTLSSSARTPEGEAKLRRALANNANPNTALANVHRSATMPSPSSPTANAGSAPLMMRSLKKARA